MKRFLIAALLVIGLLAAGGYILYRKVMPHLVAKAVTSHSLPGYIPKRLKNRVEAIRKPINKGTEAIIEKMHDADITLEDVLLAVDNISEEEAYAFLDEFNETDHTSPDDVFDVAKKHFKTSFDLEVFREPFRKHFKLKQIRSVIDYASLNRRSNDVDFATAKVILKMIIIEKEKEVVGKVK